LATGQIVFYFLAGLLPLVFVAFFTGRRRALATAGETQLHSRPGYYGWYAVVWLAVPAIAVSLVAALLELTGLTDVPAPMALAAALALAAGGLWLGLRTVHPGLRARNIVEAAVRWLLVAASLVSILTTLGIVLSILFEAVRFFQIVSLWEFLTGTTWSPDTAFPGAPARTWPRPSSARCRCSPAPS
jgi:phosphate transport system permease protein